MKLVNSWLVLAAVFMLSACGGDEEKPSIQTGELLVNVSGLHPVEGGAIAGLTLQNSETGDKLNVVADGVQTISSEILVGSNYHVVVTSQPLDIYCSVSDAQGVYEKGLRSSTPAIPVNCVSATAELNGGISDLTGTLQLTNLVTNETLDITANGGFTFTKKMVGNAVYTVQITTQPEGLFCSVQGLTGVVTAEAELSISCFDAEQAKNTLTYTIWDMGSQTDADGNITYMTDGLQLINSNNGVTHEVITNAEVNSYNFSAMLIDEQMYSVEVYQQPPEATCVIKNGSGTFTLNAETNDAELNQVEVNCAWNDRLDHTLTVDVGGLTGSLVLLNKTSGEQIEVTADGRAEFLQKMGSNQPYDLVVISKPVSQTCVVNGASGNYVYNAGISISCGEIRYNLEVEVKGSNGHRVTLTNNGVDLLKSYEDKVHTVDAAFIEGEAYQLDVTIEYSDYACSVTNGVGTVAGADVTGVVVTCQQIHTLNGNVVGLNGSIELTNTINGEVITVSSSDVASGIEFSFPTTILISELYQIEVTAKPALYSCFVVNGSGGGGDADSFHYIEIRCVDTSLLIYSLGGEVTGLNGTLELVNYDGQTLTITENGSFAFAQKIKQDEFYQVQVKSAPEGFTCDRENFNGTAIANVSNISFHCYMLDATPEYELHGYGLSGLKPSIVVAGLSVSRRSDNAPLTDLKLSDLIVKENEELIGADQFLTLEKVEPESVTLHTVLMLDIGNSFLPADIAIIKAATKALLFDTDEHGVKTSKLLENESVTIYTFDSVGKVVINKTRDLEALELAIDNIDDNLLNRSGSTNLFGAAREAIELFEDNITLDKAEIGQIIMVTDGKHDVDDSYWISHNLKDVIVLAVGGSVDQEQLKKLTNNTGQVITISDLTSINRGLSDVRNLALSNLYMQDLYRVYYATPKRSGWQYPSIQLNTDPGCEYGRLDCSDSINGSVSANDFTDMPAEIQLNIENGSENGTQLMLTPVQAATVTASLRWINATPEFSFALDNVTGTLPVMAAVDAISTITIDAGFTDATLTVADSVTGLVKTVTLLLDTDADGIADITDTDDDNDGYIDTIEVAAGTDPLDVLDFPLDTDGDLEPDYLDTDDDNDGHLDTVETAAGTDPVDALSFPIDTDGDTELDYLDTDDDNDGYIDTVEVSEGTDPLLATSMPLDTDGDFDPDSTDPDDDGDGYSDVDEVASGSDPLLASDSPADNDGDFSPDAVDLDDDNDGTPDTSDDYPFDGSRSVNALPVVNAGINIAVTSASSFTLTATATDSNGTVDSVLWEQVAGQSATLVTDSGLSMDYTAPTVTTDDTLEFTLTVTDNDGGQTIDTVFVRVNPPSSATGTLNDTGITTCSNATVNGLACPVASFAGQDAEFGRDVSSNIAADGHAGFSFTKLDVTGVALLDQTLTYAVQPWSCVKDNVTGLIWEVKTTVAGLQMNTNTYSWYSEDDINNGGDAGTANGGVCTRSDCDTAAYVAAVNTQGLCGKSDWRMPDVSELLSVVNYGTSAPLIDVNFFPNVGTGQYWTSVTRSDNANKAVLGGFILGGFNNADKLNPYLIRLVRSGL